MQFNFKDIQIYFGVGMFANLRKPTIRFIMSVRPSLTLEQLGSH